MECPVCGAGELLPHSDGKFDFRHGKKDYAVPNQHYAKCESCETSGYLPGQLAANAESIKKFQSALPDYISPSDVLAVRERYGLTQKQATKIFKGGATGFSKWERGISFPCGATSMLLKAALESIEAMTAFAKIANVDFPIIDQKPVTTASEEKPAVSSTSVVYHCTHSEYRDEVVADLIDNDFDNEVSQKWMTLNTRM